MIWPSPDNCGFHIERNAGEERRKIQIVVGRHADAGNGIARHPGDEVLIVACLDDGFLIVDRRNPRARQHTRLTLGQPTIRRRR